VEAPAANTPVDPGPAPVAPEAPAPQQPAPAEAPVNNPSPGSGGNSAPSAGIPDPASSNTLEIVNDGNRSIFTERDSNGEVVSTTIIIDMGDGRESVIVKDKNGNVTDAFVQNAPQEVVVSAQRGAGAAESPPASNPAPSTPPAPEEGEKDDDNKNDDDDNDDDDTDDPPAEEAPAEEPEGEDPPAEEAEEAEKGTPNPLDERGGSGFELSEATGGRLGGDSARRQQRQLDLLKGGGGAGGPPANENSGSGILLTPEEQANFRRLIGVKSGGAVTNPNPLDEGGVTVTDRDLKELHLRGNGGAGTPPEAGSGAPPPQDPNSPIGNPAPVGGPAPSRVSAPGVKLNQNIQINTEVKEQVR
jgi:hypothetical protein